MSPRKRIKVGTRGIGSTGRELMLFAGRLRLPKGIELEWLWVVGTLWVRALLSEIMAWRRGLSHDQRAVLRESRLEAARQEGERFRERYSPSYGHPGSGSGPVMYLSHFGSDPEPGSVNEAWRDRSDWRADYISRYPEESTQGNAWLKGML